jgi:hypothetical protein
MVVLFIYHVYTMHETYRQKLGCCHRIICICILSFLYLNNVKVYCNKTYSGERK